MASTAGAKRKPKTAGSSVYRCVAKRWSAAWRTGGIDQRHQAVEEMTAGDGQAVVRDFTPVAAVAHRQALLQDGLEAPRPRRTRIVGRHVAAASQEVREASASAPLENGAAWRLPARRAASNSFLRPEGHHFRSQNIRILRACNKTSPFQRPQ
jgi:hypothetical protein